MDITALDLSKFNYKKNVLLNEISTFKIGGVINYFFQPKSQSELINIVRLLDEHHIHFHLIGRASNILFADEMKTEVGISTLLVKSNSLSNHEITVDGGFSLRELCYICAENDLTGLEGLSGIPGTVGGAVYMNAGAYGYTISDFLTKVTVFHRDNNNIITYNKEECGFDYRKSRFMDDKHIILGIKINLQKGNKEQILNEMKSYEIKRSQKQPLDYPSAGSIFKKPSLNFHPAYEIELLGLKGYTIGGACVSTKHSGFIINQKDASAHDVKNLINHLQKKIFKKTGIFLETEINFFD
ncbi:MAG: UDP-N-acetylmuramate dehydrogenase [Thermotogota bacterium]|nr:UDP-N-acetylmuramate dehydrogenase [Thermotogota bacterium]